MLVGIRMVIVVANLISDVSHHNFSGDLLIEGESVLVLHRSLQKVFLFWFLTGSSSESFSRK